jgi:LacI family transcriptional regulator
LPIPGLPSIGPDNQAVARLALEHLRERGFRQLGFCGLPRGVDPPMDDRADAFLESARQTGLPCSRFPAARRGSWEREHKLLIQWVRLLPKPAGVMTCNDTRGLQVLRACFQAGIAVPDQVAVVGAGNDDCLCSLAHPPLSSIDLAPELVGYEAAALLDRLMARRGALAAPIQLPPRGIVTRLSTDVLATPDAAVAKAVAFIRGRACDGLKVTEVLRHVGLSRSALEPRLKKVLGRTVHHEIERVRIDRARVLLATTDLPTKQIAAQTGFRYVQYLTRVFRKVTGHTPAHYRKQARW